MTKDSRKLLARTGQLLVVILSLVSSSIRAAQPIDTSRIIPPNARLGVLIVVDQMRPDYLSRFSPEFTGGLARLLKQGVDYTNAFHDHAATETAVGHSAIGTGRFPSHNGIVGNDWYDRELKRVVYSCEDSSVHIIGDLKLVGRSPKLMLTNGLGDWLKEARPGAKVYSVSLKDRAAIAMAGRKPDGVFWYNRSTGQYITSDYYMSGYPACVDSFNASGLVDSAYHLGWNKLLPDSAYVLSHRDDFPSENDGRNTSFPHYFDTTSTPHDKKFHEALYGTPFADEMTLALAKVLVRSAELGKDTIPDLLCISCSAADAIGHTYGPNSQEIQDYYLRLDRYLDTFFVFLDSVIGVQNYCVVLASDHGVLPLPEDLTQQGIAATRFSVDTVVKDIIEIGQQLKTSMHFAANPIADCGYDIRLSYDDSRMAGISDPDFQLMVAARIRKLPYIADAFTRDELQSGAGEGRPYYELFHNCFEPVRGPDIYLRFSEYMLVGKSKFGTSHGTPYSYDTDVPIVFVSRISAPGRSDERVRTVDIAPTLARLLGVVPPKDIDGHPLVRVLEPKP